MLPPLPSYMFRRARPSLLDMARQGVGDLASVVPAAILDQPAVQLPGPGAPLVVADPALVREVLNDRDGRFVRDRLLRRLFRRSWGRGLAAAEGDDWQRQRRAASPAFRPQAVEANSAAFAAAAGEACASWPLGERVELTGRAAQIVADIVFSVLVDGGGTVDTRAVAADMPAYVRRIAIFGLRDMLPLPESWHDRLSGIDRDPVVRRLRALAANLAAQRSTGAPRDDLIARLDGIGPVEDNIRGLFPAAMDTTVAGIGWTLYTLALRPDWQSRVAEEARGNDGHWILDDLPVTQRVVREVLRLYPPGPFLIRSAATNGELGGFPVRKGQAISLGIYPMHRHRNLWDKPDEFDPDRFLPEHGAPPGWMPFGAGPRVCIAAQFALTEIAVVVARLLSELEFTPAGPEPQVTLQVATRSSTGLNVSAQRRS
jgi:cytochrome P450